MFSFLPLTSNPPPSLSPCSHAPCTLDVSAPPPPCARAGDAASAVCARPGYDGHFSSQRTRAVGGVRLLVAQRSRRRTQTTFDKPPVCTWVIAVLFCLQAGEERAGELRQSRCSGCCRAADSRCGERLQRVPPLPPKLSHHACSL